MRWWTWVLLVTWAHVNGASFAYAVIDDSHGRPYPDRPLLVVATVLLLAAVASALRDRATAR